jgi:hypothetical protein
MPLIGPKATPKQFGLKPADIHLVVNDQAETAKIFRGDGTLLATCRALARGQGSDTVWNQRFSDTPPGLYKGGQLYRDFDFDPVDRRETREYGWYSLDLIDLEGQERKNGRSGIMLHGGGKALGWPGAWAPFQPLLPTLGCIRMHNADIRDHIVNYINHGAEVFVSVYQEAP